MQRKCLKCDHIHTGATGHELEACPQCGAIYTRLTAALAMPRRQGSSRPLSAHAENVLTEAKETQLKQKKMLQECWMLLALLGVMAIVWIYFKASNSNVPEPSSRNRVESQVVSNSPLDGSVRQVERYLKASLKDPNSLEVMEWGHVVADTNGFLVRVKYRARNSFGAYSVEQQVFQLDAGGTVVAVNRFK